MGRFIARVVAALVVVLAGVSAHAEDTFKVGTSVGLIGYIAASDIAWRDGLLLAAGKINAAGGIAGKKVEIIVDDNHSQPQDAVVGYRRMISDDQVKVFISGCVTAGTFAAASSIAKAQIPLLGCTIPPPLPEQQAWMFEIRPPPAAGIDGALTYLHAKRGVDKIGILHDQTPYSSIQTDIATKLAAKKGMQTIVESYNQDDADMSVQIGRINAAKAQAILKIGLGGSTVTVAKNIKQLGLKIIFYAGDDDSGIYKQAYDVLGDQFLAGADPTQIYQALPDGAAKNAIATFMESWQAKYHDRDPHAAAYSWDSLWIVKTAVEASHPKDGPELRDAIEKVAAYQGVGGVYRFSKQKHWGIMDNTQSVATFKDGKMVPLELGEAFRAK